MFLCEERSRVRQSMGEGGAEVRFRFDFEGTKVMIQSAGSPVAVLAGGLATRLGPIDSRDAQVPARGGGPTIHSPSAPAISANRRSAEWLFVSATLASGWLNLSVKARRSAWRLSTRSTDLSCWGPPVHCVGACRCWGPPSSSSTATPTSIVITRPSRKPYEAAGSRHS